MLLDSRAAILRQGSVVALCWVAGVSAVLTACPAGAAAISYDEALVLATRQAPTLAAAQSKVDAARQAAVAAGELPDPRLALGVDNYPISGPDAFSLTSDSMTMRRFALMQEVPNRDKRDARIAMAQARIVRGEAETRVLALTAKREAALAWTRRYTIERQLSALDGLFAENRLFDTVVRAQLAGGRGMPSDAIMPRQEAAMLAERQDELRAQREMAVAALRRWVGDAGGEPLEGEPRRWAFDREALQHRLHRHPEIAAFDAMAGTLDAELREARSMKKPDWGVELAYQRRGQQYGNMVSLQFSIDLPVFAQKRQDPQIAAKLAELQGVEAERESVRREHAQMLAGDWAELDRLDRALVRVRDTSLPLAQERIDLTLASYRAGKSALADVIAARRERVETLLKAVMLQGERDAAAARLYFAFDEEADGAHP